MSINVDDNNEEIANQFLTFILGGAEYGIDILKVQEIRGWEETTSIPNTPDYVLGVLNLRGIVVPIIDLRVRFTMETADFGSETVVVIVKISQNEKERTVGLVVDAISDVYSVKETDIKDAPEFGGSLATEFINGLTTVNEKMIILLNVDLLVNVGVLEHELDISESA